MNKIKTKHNKVVTRVQQPQSFFSSSSFPNALIGNPGQYNLALDSRFRGNDNYESHLSIRGFQKALSLVISLLLAFSPITYATSVDYLIGTLGNAFKGKLEGGATLFEIESGRIGVEDTVADDHPNVEIAGNIAKISAGAGNAAYFVVDGAPDPDRGGQNRIAAVSIKLTGFVADYDYAGDDYVWKRWTNGDAQGFTSIDGKVNVFLEGVSVGETFAWNRFAPDGSPLPVEFPVVEGEYSVITITRIGEKLQIQNLGAEGQEKLKLTATIISAHTSYSSVEGTIDGKYSNYNEIKTYDDNGMLWQTSTVGIRGGDIAATTTYNGYDQLNGELRYTYTFGYSNGALNNYVELLDYDEQGRVDKNTRTGVVGGDTYGDGDLVAEETDYVTTNIYEGATLASVHVEGQINGRRSNFNRDFTYDSLGRVTETSYSPFDIEQTTLSQWDDYVIVNGGVYGGETAEKQYTEITTYASDGNVGTVRREGRIDGMRDNYSQNYTYTKRGQVKDTLSNGTVRGNTYTNLKETNIIVKENTMTIGAALSDINSGRTLASITDGTINGAQSDVVTRYKYDNDGFDDGEDLNGNGVLDVGEDTNENGELDLETPFTINDKVGRQIATFTRGIRDATYYGDGEKAITEDYDAKRYVNLLDLFIDDPADPGDIYSQIFDAGGDRILTSNDKELIKSAKLRGTTVTLKDKNNIVRTTTQAFVGVTTDRSFVTYSKYDRISGQVVKTQSGVKVNTGTDADPNYVIKGGLINATENFYSTIYKYDTDNPLLADTGLGREVETATRGIRGGRIYGLLDSANTVENLEWAGIDAGADYVEANTYYTFEDKDYQGNTLDANTHLFRLKSTRTKGWTDGEVNDYTRKLDYDNDKLGVAWIGGQLAADDGTQGDGRVARTITSGIVSARCYGDICSADAAKDFDLTDPTNKNFHFAFTNDNRTPDDFADDTADPTANIYQEVSSYDGQGRVTFAKNLGLINGAKDNYRVDYFYETGTDMVGRQQKSVTNSRAVGDGNAIVNASIRINYVEETFYDDSLIDIDKDDPKGRGLRKRVEVTGFDGGAFNNYLQLFKYQENTGPNTYANIAGRMSEARYRGMRGGSLSGYMKGLTLNEALNDFSRTTAPESFDDGWVESADFLQRLVYAEIDNAEFRAGQQTWVETEGTSAGASNDYRTLNGYDTLGRQSSRKIEGEHEYSKLKIVDNPDEGGLNDPDIIYDSNSGLGYGIVGGMFSRSNESMEYSANGSLKYIINSGGFSERVEESIVLSGEDNYKRVFVYNEEKINTNELLGQDMGFGYEANDGYLAPMVGGSAYFGADQVEELNNKTVTRNLEDKCLGENCNYKINYTYDQRGQRLTQHSWGFQAQVDAAKLKVGAPLKGSGISVQKDYYTTTFGYDQYGRTAKTAYDIGGWVRGAQYGIAPEKNGKKVAPDREYITTYKYNDLGFQLSQLSTGYRNANFDNFTRTSLTAYTNKAGRIFENYWGRAIASSVTGIQGGQNQDGTVSASPEALGVIFNGLSDSKDPLASVVGIPGCENGNGDDCASRSYLMKIGDTFTVYIDSDEDGTSGGEANEIRTYEIVEQDGLEGAFDLNGDGTYEISLKNELGRRIRDSVSKIIANPAPGEEDFTYGDMYAGPRPCVRQTDGTLNCAH